ncbi:MAG: alpha/beta hydrolase family protein [Puia sp.]|nr:alpha/beta hydrolase family protein [Puia sp.]
MSLPLVFSLLFSLPAFAGHTDTIVVYSPSMKKDIKCVVILPTRYLSAGHGKNAVATAAEGKSLPRLPVVYLLHGWSGNYAQWPGLAPQLARKADELNILIVCPDGGYGSWYFDSPVDSSIRYETFISRELVTYIDRHYPTAADRAHRAITGLSMGGHGGLYLGIRHKDLYGAAGSMSGGVDFRPFPDNWDLKKDLGDSACCWANWENNTVTHAVEGLKNGEIRLIFDCGTGDDYFIGVNRALHQKLLDKQIDHDYAERPGAHEDAYWRNSVDYQLLFFWKYFSDDGRHH